MSIRIGIYDFFAYTLPGGLLLLLGWGELYACGWTSVAAWTEQPSTWQVLFLVIGGYLTGYVFDPVVVKWNGLFEPKNASGRALDLLKKRHPHLSIQIEAVDWPIWMAGIRRENLDLALEIDRWMAIAKMLRGISFVLALSGLSVAAHVLGGTLAAGWLLAIPLLAGFCVMTVRQSLRFKRNFYLVIFETILSRQEPFNRTAWSENAPLVENPKKAP